MKSLKLGLAVGLLGLGSLAQAGLIPYTANGVDLVFDDDYTPVGASSAGLTWTADANLAASNTFGLPTGTDLGFYPGDTSGAQGRINADGRMNWPGALFWIDAMNAAGYGGASDWRLGSALNSDGSDPCFGFGPGTGCTDSELGHLFYTEGGLSPSDAITDSALLDANQGGAFTNLQDSLYWSGTEYAPDPSGAWRFGTDVGFQDVVSKDREQYGWAVRPGQVPLPGTAVLMALGLFGLGARRRVRRSTLALR
jgi:hypothetical protein